MVLSQGDRPGMVLPKDALERTGYRIPTEAEWEYACRSGTTTIWPHGLSEPRLKDYAWTLLNSGRVLHPPGLKLPNDAGLFDILGNASEWCIGLVDDPNVFRTREDILPVHPGQGGLRGRFAGRFVPGPVGRHPPRESEPPPVGRAAAVSSDFAWRAPVPGNHGLAGRNGKSGESVRAERR